jgi:hypothetical protein
MNKRQTTMLASIAAVTMVGAMLVLSGVFGKAIAFNPTGAPDYTVAPQGGVNGASDLNGQVTHMIVEINSPFGSERITSFTLFQTDNLMKQTGYQTLRLVGPIVNDKRTLLMWAENDLGKLQAGQYTNLPITTGGGKPAVMSSVPAGATITTVPLTGSLKLMLLEKRVDMYAQNHEYTRAFDFSGCHVAGYNLGSMFDDEKQFFRDGLQHFEEVVFACSKVTGVAGQSMNSRGIIVDTAINNDNREIMNEKGELIINSREYRQPIVMENQQEEEQSLKLEIATNVQTNKQYYEAGEAAKFTVTFTDLEGNAINPDTIRAYYDGKIVQLVQEDDVGVYAYITPGLTKENHQLIVSAEKEGFATDTTYLSIPIHRVS